MNIQTYEFPGWDVLLRCACHMSDCCPDLEYLYDLQQRDDEWNSLSEEEKAEFLVEVEIVVEVIEPDGEDWPF